jgi:hypothetical protein
MPTCGRDNIIGKLKREPVANVMSDAVIGKVKYWKALSVLAPSMIGTCQEAKSPQKVLLMCSGGAPV